MTLSEKQQIFSINFAKLVTWGNKQQGKRVVIDGTARTLSQQILFYTGHGVDIVEGKPVLVEADRASQTLNSAHCDRLAGDLILHVFKGGKWVYSTKSDDYAFLGEFWKRLNEKNVWGGDWKKLLDGGHFEMKK